MKKFEIENIFKKVIIKFVLHYIAFSMNKEEAKLWMESDREGGEGVSE